MSTEQASKERAAERAATIAALRDLAHYLETYELAPLPFVLQMNAFIKPADDVAEIARRVGDVEKRFNGPYLFLEKQFGPLTYCVTIDRERVCTKTVVGKRTVTVEEEDVEWSCADSLLGGRS